MFALTKPTAIEIMSLLDAQRGTPFSYREVGITRVAMPSSLRRTHHRVHLGTGEKVFTRGVAAMNAWTMYALDWTELYPPQPAVREGSEYATIVQHLGFWSANPCRVVYCDSARGGIDFEAFAIGTLPEHAERGEERFSVSWHHADDSVWFDILAYAEPHHWLAKLGTPVVHALQARFATEAMRAMQDAVGT